MVFARLVTHYWAHAAWLPDGALLGGAGKLAGIPGVLVTGRVDISGPPDIAWQLDQAWPDAGLVIVEGATHGTGHAETVDALVGAIDRFAQAGPPWAGG
jgi:proline iminopeptidase